MQTPRQHASEYVPPDDSTFAIELEQYLNSHRYILRDSMEIYVTVSEKQDDEDTQVRKKELEAHGFLPTSTHATTNINEADEGLDPTVPLVPNRNKQAHQPTDVTLTATPTVGSVRLQETAAQDRRL